MAGRPTRSKAKRTGRKSQSRSTKQAGWLRKRNNRQILQTAGNRGQGTRLRPPARPDSLVRTTAVRILLVEDSRLLRRSVGAALRKVGYAVDATGDGKEGLWLAESNAYDSVI